MLKEFKINAEMCFVRDWKEIEARGCLNVELNKGSEKYGD